MRPSSRFSGRRHPVSGKPLRRRRMYLLLAVAALLLLCLVAISVSPATEHSGMSASKQPRSATATRVEQWLLGARGDALKHPGKASEAAARGSSCRAGAIPEGFDLSNVTKMKFAYLAIISNEAYVDGALVLGTSLAQQSALVGRGVVDLVLIYTHGATISSESEARLRCAGWQHFLRVDDLSDLAPHAKLRATFSKLHMFNVTQYQRIVIYDGDTLIASSPDSVFRVHLPSEQYVGAIGSYKKANSSKAAYFHTGMMLVWPCEAVFRDLLYKLLHDPEERRGNGRDGKLIRDYFEDRFVHLDYRLSIHVPPGSWYLQSVVGVHFRGKWKPWYNKAEKDRAHTVREVGAAYQVWWDTYEALHQRCFAAMDAELLQAAARGSGAVPLPEGYDPKRHVWMMRHTPQAYIQLHRYLELEQRNLSFPNLQLVVSDEGQSCDAACEAAGPLSCSEAALHFTEMHAKHLLQAQFHCQRVDDEFPAADEPSYNVSSRTCYVNTMNHGMRTPTCAAATRMLRRLCPCLPHIEGGQPPLPVPYRDAPFWSVHQFSRRTGVAPATPSVVAGLSASPTARGGRVGACDFDDGQLPWRGVSDAACVAYLANWSNVVHLSVVPRSLTKGRTPKLLVHYRGGGGGAEGVELPVQAMLKFPQRAFPHEAESEYAAYVVDRLLGLARVPPTTLVTMPVERVREAFRNESDSEQQFLAVQLWAADLLGPTHPTMGATLTVSVQLWVESVQALHTSPAAVHLEDLRLWLQPRQVHGNRTTAPEQLLRDVTQMVLFDFIIGNDDRTLLHNCHVVFPRNASGAARLVHLDQGRSLYYLTNPENNLFSDVLRSEGGASATFCRAPREMMAAALNHSGPSQGIHRGEWKALRAAVALTRSPTGSSVEGGVCHAEDEQRCPWPPLSSRRTQNGGAPGLSGPSSDTSNRDNNNNYDDDDDGDDDVAVDHSNTLATLLLRRLSLSRTSSITESVVHAMQYRLHTILTFMDHCVTQFGVEAVLFDVEPRR